MGCLDLICVSMAEKSVLVYLKVPDFMIIYHLLSQPQIFTPPQDPQTFPGQLLYTVTLQWMDAHNLIQLSF